MRKLAVLLGCLLLTACGSSSWEQELRYKVISVENSTPTEFLKLELVSDTPKDVLWPEALTPQLVRPRDISGDATVGDEVVCTAKQEKGSAFASHAKETRLSGCKKA